MFGKKQLANIIPCKRTNIAKLRKCSLACQSESSGRCWNIKK